MLSLMKMYNIYQLKFLETLKNILVMTHIITKML